MHMAFNIKQYLKEGKIYENETNPPETQFQVGDKVAFDGNLMNDKAFEDDIQYYSDLQGVIEDIDNFDIMDDGSPTNVLFIKLNKNIKPPGGYEDKEGMDYITLVQSEGDFDMIKKI